MTTTLAIFLLSTTWSEGLVQITVSFFTLVLIPMIGLFFHRQAAKAQKQAAQADLDRKTQLKFQIASFIFDAAANIADKRFQPLAQKIVNKQMDEEAVKAELRTWGDEVKNAAVDHFKGQEIDILKEFGSVYLEQVIEAAANKVNPFPGQPTATVLSQPAVAQAVADNGPIAGQYVMTLSGGTLTPNT